VINKHKSDKRGEFLFFTILFSVVFFLFKRAFSINFILDDFIFLKLGKLQSFTDFLHIFSPYKTFFYRPIPTEIFYFFINKMNNNLFVSHLIVFSVYCIGLFFLYRCLNIVTKKRDLSMFITALYAIHFTHVFQLYELATFIEVCLFTFGVLTVYFFLQKNLLLSLVFFICALLSKETALLIPLFMVALDMFNIWKLPTKKITFVIPYIVLSGIAFMLYRPSVTYLQNTEPLYAIRLSPKLIGNNLMWYGLWSLGFPNFLPDYLTSIFAKPLPKFWGLFNNVDFSIYFYSLISYYVLFAITIIKLLIKESKELKKNFYLALFLMGSFILFIGATLPTIHKWMVRLTVPLIFIVILQGIVIYVAFSKKGALRLLSYILVLLYITIQIAGVPIHEKSSVYLLQSAISSKMKSYCEANKAKLKLKSTIYFIDTVDNGLWGGSQMLRNTLHESDFIDAFCPKEIGRAYFNYKDKIVPKNSYIIDSAEIIVK